MYYDDRFPEVPTDDSILNLARIAQKCEMYKEGITTLWNTDIDRIEGTRHQYAWVVATRSHELHVDKGALRCWKRTHIQTPVSHLDFEWETYASPPYEGMKPFDVLVFQYSPYIKEQQKLCHVDFIEEGDCRGAFLEHLLAHIPKAGIILVHNMDGAEKLRLVQPAQRSPKYEGRLRTVWERMTDLSLPFSTGNVYDIRMADFYSLERLVLVSSDYSYRDLEISYDMDTVEKWGGYCTADAEKKQEIYGQLEQCCAIDTYTEYIVYRALEDMMHD